VTFGAKEEDMDATIKTSLNLGETNVYKVSDAKYHVSAGHFKDCHDKSCGYVDRIMMTLVDPAQKGDSPRRHNCLGLSLCAVYMSIEEAEELQTQLAAAITEKRRRDNETQGKGSYAPS
jgi:hypothetical protein